MPDHLQPDINHADRGAHFENALWPHMAAAYSFARWMVRNHHDAEDVVQESFVKALRAAGTFRGADLRSWLLAIVRNNALTFLSRHKREIASDENTPEPVDSAPDPEMSLVQQRHRARVREAIARLPVEFREALLLREMEGLTYKEIAEVLKVPLGTVMSRLSRARRLLMDELTEGKENHDDLR